MRFLTCITTQDHVIYFIETTELHDEVTCLTTADANTAPTRGEYLSKMTTFTSEGTGKMFKPDGVGGWEVEHSGGGPNISAQNSNSPHGYVSTSSGYKVIAIFPKDDTVLSQYENVGFTEENRNKILAADRESFVEIFKFSTDRKMDPDTFDQLVAAGILDSELVFI